MYKIGLVGFPNSGKSSLFRFLTKKEVKIASFAFATIDPNIGVMNFLDQRLDNLSQYFQSLKVSTSAVEIVDIAGLVRGASEGLGLGNEFLSHIREVDMICHVVRCFSDSNVQHVEKTIDPTRDYEIIQLELIASDLQQIQRKIKKIQPLCKKQANNEGLKKELSLLEYLQNNLEKENLISKLNVEEEKKIKEYNLLTSKKSIIIVNYNGEEKEKLKKLEKFAEIENIPLFAFSVKLESECQKMSAEEKKELGYQPFNIFNIAEEIKKTLGLKNFFTAGLKETKSWLIEKKADARKCAALIHSNIAKGFIRAEIYNYEDWLELSSKEKIKETGKIRKEGADYIIKEGDICYFHFSKTFL